LKSKKPVSGFRFLSWYVLGPTSSPFQNSLRNLESITYLVHLHGLGMGQRSDYSFLIKVLTRFLILGRVDANSD